VTPTPTFDFPDFTAKMQANCRYGPGKAYMFSHGLYPGDTGEVHNRNFDGTWLWIKPDNLNRRCWASIYVMDVVGDIWTVVEYRSRLPFTTYIGPPKSVSATRDGDQVTVSWSAVTYQFPEDLRGYLIEAKICTEGELLPRAYHTNDTSITIMDEAGCKQASSGLLYAAEKHGYTDPLIIPWP
jgi:hypothetical protein